MPGLRYVEEDSSAAMLTTKTSAGVTPEVNLMKHVTHTPLPIINKAAHSVFETQRRRHLVASMAASHFPTCVFQQR